MWQNYEILPQIKNQWKNLQINKNDNWLQDIGQYYYDVRVFQKISGYIKDICQINVMSRALVVLVWLDGNMNNTNQCNQKAISILITTISYY